MHGSEAMRTRIFRRNGRSRAAAASSRGRRRRAASGVRPGGAMRPMQASGRSSNLPSAMISSWLAVGAVNASS